MAYIIKDRVQQTATVTGTGNITLLGSINGFINFSGLANVNDTFPYLAINPTKTNWETGIGTYLANDEIQRTNIKSSSNNNNIVSFTGEIINIGISNIADSNVKYNAINNILNISGSLAFTNATTSIATNQNDYVLSATAFQRINCTSASSITGIAPPTGDSHVDGRTIRIYNVGSYNLTLSHNNGSSSSANRMFNKTSANIILGPNDYAELIYDATSNGSGAAGWRVKS